MAKSDFGAHGIWSAQFATGSPAEVSRHVAELDAQGWGAIWFPGMGGGDDVYGIAERLLQAGNQAKVAVGVAGIWELDPAATARTHRRLQDAYGDRLVSGFGVSGPDRARAAGKEFGSPLAAMRKFLDDLDAADPPLPRDERVIGTLGRRITMLAGERAAGVHPFLVTPVAVARDRALIGPDALIAPYLPVVLETDPVRARAIARHGIGMFLGIPSYQGNLLRLGFGEEDFAPGGSDRLIDSLVAWGYLAKITTRIREFQDAGADHLALHALTGSDAFPVAEWKELSGLLS